MIRTKKTVNFNENIGVKEMHAKARGGYGGSQTRFSVRYLLYTIRCSLPPEIATA